MSTNDTNLTDDQFHTAMSMYKGCKTYQISTDLKNIMNYVYECAIENINSSSNNLIDAEQLDK